MLTLHAREVNTKSLSGLRVDGVTSRAAVSYATRTPDMRA